MAFEKAQLVKGKEGWYFCCCVEGCHGCCGARYGPWTDKAKAQEEGDFYFSLFNRKESLTDEEYHRREHILKWTIFQRKLRGIENG